MNRSHSTIYRICLLAVVVLTIAGGIFYYVNFVEKQTTVTEGTLVWKEEPKDMPAGQIQVLPCSAAGKESLAAGRPEHGAEAESTEDGTVIESFRPFGSVGKRA